MKKVKGFKLGQFAIDGLTGFNGTIVERSMHFNGCIHYYIRPKGLTIEGKLKNGLDIDEQRVQCSYTQTYEMPEFEMGDHVADIVSGLEGYVNYICHLLNGTVSIGIIAKQKDEETPSNYSFDSTQVKLIAKATKETDSVSVVSRDPKKPTSPVFISEQPR